MLSVNEIEIKVAEEVPWSDLVGVSIPPKQNEPQLPSIATRDFYDDSVRQSDVSISCRCFDCS